MEIQASSTQSMCIFQPTWHLNHVQFSVYIIPTAIHKMVAIHTQSPDWQHVISIIIYHSFRMSNIWVTDQ
jgi:hypothetical protein